MRLSVAYGDYRHASIDNSAGRAEEPVLPLFRCAAYVYGRYGCGRYGRTPHAAITAIHDVLYSVHKIKFLF